MSNNRETDPEELILTLSTPPAIEPVTLTEARTHLRLEDGSGEPAPDVFLAALASPAAPGNVDNGAHRYRATFVTADGETEAGTISAIVTVADKTVNGQVSLTAIPRGGSTVTARKIYRTAAAGSTYLLLTTISNNTATTYTDNIADASLGAGAPATNTTGDTYLASLVTAARQWVEDTTHRSFITQTWKWYLKKFSDEMEVPRSPLQSVTSITYVDSAGATQTLAAGFYTVDTDSKPGRILLTPNESWPVDVDNREKSICITFVAGYGAAASIVPATDLLAIKLQLEILFDRPGQDYLTPLERARDALLAVNRIYTL